MLSFVAYVRESKAAWHFDSRYVFFADDIFLPITERADEGTAFHVCNLANFKQLVVLQHSDKHISATSKPAMISKPRGGGGRAGLGIIAKITGQIHIHSQGDFKSMPDQQGHRWIPVSWAHDRNLAAKLEMDVFEAKLRILKRVLGDRAADVLHAMGADKPGHYGNFMRYAKKAPDSTARSLRNVKWYMGAVEPHLDKTIKTECERLFQTWLKPWVVAHAEDIARLVEQPLKNKYHDELIMSHFVIDEVLTLDKWADDVKALIRVPVQTMRLPNDVDSIRRFAGPHA